MIRVEHVMGTVVSIDWRDDDLDPGTVDAAAAWFHQVDERFSPFKPESEVSQISAGRLAEPEYSAGMKYVISLCDHVRDQSDGLFDAWRLQDGERIFDPSAVVKGWSVDRAAALLEKAGARNFCINAGGDVLTRGAPEPGALWKIGLRHPDEADKVTGVVSVHDSCIATSGTYERGKHIVIPQTGDPTEGELQSVSVFGPTLALADAYSTAVFAMGRAGVDWMLQRTPYEVYAVTSAHHALYSPGFAELLETPSLSWD